jgi:hypothetical protein
MAFWMIMLPEVRAVISIPSRMGTPELVRVPSVRQKRATAVFLRISPRTGIFRRKESIWRRPAVVL